MPAQIRVYNVSKRYPGSGSDEPHGEEVLKQRNYYPEQPLMHFHLIKCIFIIITQFMNYNVYASPYQMLTIQRDI